MICCWAQRLAEAVILHRLGPHDGSRQGADGAITHRPSLPPLRLTPVPAARRPRPLGDTRAPRKSTRELSLGSAPSFVGHFFPLWVYDFFFPPKNSGPPTPEASHISPHTQSALGCILLWPKRRPSKAFKSEGRFPEDLEIREMGFFSRKRENRIFHIFLLLK